MCGRVFLLGGLRRSVIILCYEADILHFLTVMGPQFDFHRSLRLYFAIAINSKLNKTKIPLAVSKGCPNHPTILGIQKD